MECVKSLKAQDPRIVNPSSPTLSIKQSHAIKHALNPKEITFRILLRTSRQELPLATPDLYFQWPGKVKLKLATRIRHPNDVTSRALHSVLFHQAQSFSNA